MIPDKPSVSTDSWVESEVKSKVSSYLVEFKNSILDFILSDEQKEGRALKVIDNKRGKNIPLEWEELALLLKKWIVLDWLSLDDNSFPWNNYQTEFNDQNFCNVVLNISNNYIFNNCDFRWAVFKNIAWNNVSFNDCNLQNTQLWKIAAQELQFANCNINWIQLIENNYDNCSDLEWYSWITVRSKTKNDPVFSSDFESEFHTTCKKKINKKWIIRVRNIDWDVTEIQVLFRKALQLLGVVFLDSYKIWDTYLHKNVIYILDNLWEENNNQLRTEIHNQMDLWEYDDIYNIFPENENREMLIDIDSDESELAFKFVRPISIDRKIWYNQDVRFWDYFTKTVNEL